MIFDLSLEASPLVNLTLSGVEPTPIGTTPPVKTAPLPERQYQNLFKTLPALAVLVQPTLVLPREPKPLPQIGGVIATPFPPAEVATRPTVLGLPLAVTRYAPEGPVLQAPNLTITFNQPMVPLSSTAIPPVQVTPALPPGAWRWVGTQTLVYQPTTRFPLSSRFEVTIPAGLQSLSGQTLAQSVTWQFETSTPLLTSPKPTISLQPLIPLIFDQTINPEALRSLTTLQSKQERIPLALARPQDIDKDLLKRPKGTWLALRPLRLLDKATTYTLTIAVGSFAAEGPLPIKKPQEVSFTTYDDFKVKGISCQSQNCNRNSLLSIEFNNPLDQTKFKPELVRISPKIGDQSIIAQGNRILISGISKAGKYEITLAERLEDVFGQQLGKSKKLHIQLNSEKNLFSNTYKDQITLDPTGPKRYSIYSEGYRKLYVRLYKVKPKNLYAFRDYNQLLQSAQYSDSIPKQLSLARPPGTLASEQVLTVSEPEDAREISIDLAPALTDGVGQVLVLVRNAEDQKFIFKWLQVTQISLGVYQDPTGLLAWVNALSDGKPLAGVDVEFNQKFESTNSQGIAQIKDNNRGMLVARRGNDTAFLSLENYTYDFNSTVLETFTDRGLYRPGETVHIKGWVRQLTKRLISFVDYKQLYFKVWDTRRQLVSKGKTALSALGGFNLTVDLPPDSSLGEYSLEFSSNPDFPEKEDSYGWTTNGFKVAEFRRPEFSLTTTANPGPLFIDSKTQVKVAANYFTGSGLPKSPLQWTVSESAGSFNPPNREDFSFGIWRPWWGEFSLTMPTDDPSPTLKFNAQTNSQGEHQLNLALAGFQKGVIVQPINITATAEIQDVNRQARTATANLLIHPAAWYVGISNRQPFVKSGQPIDLETIVVDLDGKAVPGQLIKVKATRYSWVLTDQWREVVKETITCQTRSTLEAVTCRLTPQVAGEYRIEATIQDAQGRANLTETRIWLPDAKEPLGTDQQVKLIPNRTSYQPGEVAQILVQAPFFPAQGLMTLQRNGLVYHENFTMEGSTHLLKIPIKAEYLPNIQVNIDLDGSQLRRDQKGKPQPQLPPEPVSAQGSLTLSIPPLSKQLTVQVTPRDPLLTPGAATSVDLRVLDAMGLPVAQSETALVVVDESILSLTSYQLPNLLTAFYPFRPSLTNRLSLRDDLILASLTAQGALIPSQSNHNEMFLKEEKFSPMARSNALADASNENPTVNLRSNFNPLAIFAPEVLTDAQGRATVPFTLPDSLTRYRIMAVAVAGADQFGTAEATLTARLPLMVRPSAPRFLNVGDQFQFPVVLQNQTDQPLTVEVGIRATHLEFIGPAGQQVTVPPQDRVEVRFTARATQVGTAQIQVSTRSGALTDAASLTIPIQTPATTETFASYGILDRGASVQGFQPLSEVYPEVGGLQVSTSSTLLQNLTDAVLYLAEYPYGCTEQISSRILGLVALRDVLTAFKVEGLPSIDKLNAAVQRDLNRLAELQNYDGSFGFWARSEGRSWPYLGLHVAHALQRAQQKGYTIPRTLLKRSQDYLSKFQIPKDYPEATRQTLRAYSLYLRHRFGEKYLAPAAEAFIKEVGLEKLPLEAVGWLLPTLSNQLASAPTVTAIRQLLANRVEETASTAHFTTSYSDGDYLILHSNRRTDAILLEALITTDPENPLIPKLVKSLLANRIKGRWLNTQESVFSLLALDQYFQKFENTTPDFIAQIWLGDTYLGAQTHQGPSIDQQQLTLPISQLPTQASALTLTKTGEGRMYYRVGLTYAPKNPRLNALDRGFMVKRTYEAIDNPEDVRLDQEGIWHLRAGQPVRVKLTMEAPTPRYHVALVDPLPAGLEVVDPSLTGQPNRASDSSTGDYYEPSRRFRFEHQNLRDNQAEAFTSLLPSGTYTYTYIARATTPGRFIVPPSKAEEMYQPETFGRTATDQVIIEP